ncbi:MAG TPA: hypothetical protein VLG37_04135 [Candidatus Saccharimonadales bacterium]|nr:hypothetical protein [Candidatus Saccharimonadales bacterium]
MVELPPDRNAPKYIEAVVGIKPRVDDDKDIRIRELIRNIFVREAWAEEAFANIRSEQIAYLRDMVHSVGDPAYVDRATQEILRKIGGELRATVEEGEEHLAPLRGKPVLVTTNHLGTYKLASINPQVELGDDVPNYDGYDFMYPYPLYFAALSPVAEALGNALSYASIDYPGIFGQIHTAAGFIHIPPASQVSGGRTESLKQQTDELIKKRPHTALVNFPGGGTGGKYNEAGPYDLREFRTGGYVIAAELRLPILAVAQYFDPLIGMRLKVFEPFYPQPGTIEDYKRLASETQAEIQDWLKQKEQAQGFVT